MSDQVTLFGLEQMGKNNSGIGTVQPLESMGWSNFGTISDTTTTISTASASQVNAFDQTPTQSGQEITYEATLTSGQFNGETISTITLHHVNSEDQVGAGVDGLTIEKTSKFSLTSKLRIDHTDQTST